MQSTYSLLQKSRLKFHPGRVGLLLFLALLPPLVFLPSSEAWAESRSLLVDNVRLVGFSDPRPAIQKGVSLLIRDGRIAAVMPAGEAAPADTRVDGSGLTVIPGLTDMHIHLWDQAELGAYLGSGITTIRNMSGMPFHLRLAQRIDAGELSGPRLLTSGPILNSNGPNEQVNHQIVNDETAARKAVAQQHESGFRRLKVYSNLSREAYEAILDEASHRKMLITGHTPEGIRSEGVPRDRPFAITFEEILDDGFESIEHVETIVWHGLRNRRDEEAARVLAQRISDAQVAVTPTLIAYHNLLRVAQTRGEAVHRAGTEWLNPLEQATEQENFTFWANQPTAELERNAAFFSHFTKLLQKEGVLLITGTDSGIFSNPPGYSLYEELGLLVEAGLTPYDALQAATWNPALVLGETDVRGCVKAGCVADLVLYACDPLAEISCVQHPLAVVRAGHYFDAGALQSLRDNAARHDTARTLENVQNGLRAQGSDIDLQQLME